MLTNPSRQIRPPIYSLKQSKLRKRRVVRYAILYFSMFVLFILLIVGPVVAKKFIDIPRIDIMELQQPTNWNNNDTSASDTGTARGSGGARATASSTRSRTGGSNRNSANNDNNNNRMFLF